MAGRLPLDHPHLGLGVLATLGGRAAVQDGDLCPLWTVARQQHGGR
jgi:hypothetical protein